MNEVKVVEKYYTGHYPTPDEIKEELRIQNLDLHSASNLIHVKSNILMKYLKGELRMPANVWELLWIKGYMQKIGDELYVESQKPYDPANIIQDEDIDAIMLKHPSPLFRDCFRNYIKLCF